MCCGCLVSCRSGLSLRLRRLLRVGLWRHDLRIPRLVGFARCTGDGVLEATIWDVAVHPLYQGSGLGSQLMDYILDALRELGTERATLFADPGVLPFYKRLGWDLEPLVMEPGGAERQGWDVGENVPGPGTRHIKNCTA